MLFRAAALLGLAAVGTTAADLQDREPSGRCGIVSKREPPLVEDLPVRRTAGLEKSEEPTIDVDIYFHVVAATKDDDISDETLKKQLDVLNQDYTAAGITFHHKGTDRKVHPSWAADSDELAMKRELRKGSYRDLNVYYLTQPANGTLGYSAYPLINVAEDTDEFYEDGCVILASTVPGGSRTGYDMGRTTTHEVGHWFGLYHTFKDGCEGSGDLVSDTPPQKEATDKCPAEAPNSCPDSPGVDGIHNFMDYSFDACMEEFTAGQIARMRQLWTGTRAPEAGAEPEVMLD